MGKDDRIKPKEIDNNEKNNRKYLREKCKFDTECRNNHPPVCMDRHYFGIFVTRRCRKK